MATTITNKNSQQMEAQAKREIRKEVMESIASDVICNYCQTILWNTHIFHSNNGAGITACSQCKDGNPDINFERNFVSEKALLAIKQPCKYEKCKFVCDPFRKLFKNYGSNHEDCHKMFCSMVLNLSQYILLQGRPFSKN